MALVEHSVEGIDDCQMLRPLCEREALQWKEKTKS